MFFDPADPQSPADPPADGRVGADAEFVDAFVALRAERAALEAREMRLLARASEWVESQFDPARKNPYGARDLTRRSFVADLATATALSEWTVTRLLNQAADLCARFEPGVAAVEAGRISLQHLAAIQEAGAAIADAATLATFTELAIDRAQTLTPGRLGPVLAVIAAHLDPATTADRRHRAHDDRGVWLRNLPDGMAQLTATLSAVLAHGIHDRLTSDSHAIIDARPAADAAEHEPGDPAEVISESSDEDARDERTMDQLRADVLSDLLLTGTARTCTAGDGLAAITATVQVTVPILTMTGASDEPALLAGYGPIDPETAANLAGGAAGWERVLTHPVTGAVLAVDRYRPSADLKRLLVARDEHCRFAGCRRPTWRCDADHTVDAARGGITCDCNLAHLCRGHHILKHHSAWTVLSCPGGVLEWTSPTGRVHTDVPEPVVRFVGDGDPPPRRLVDEDERRREVTAWFPAAPHEHTVDGLPAPF